MHLTWRGIAFMLALIMSSGCAKKPVMEGYRIVSYDATKGLWTIIRNGTFDGTYVTKRITARCLFYKWGDHDSVKGSNACSLHVGRMMVPKYEIDGANVRTGLVIFEDPGFLTIIEGEGKDKVTQGFDILKNEVLASE